MQNCGDLQVDVNGEETFFVHKKILAYFSGRIVKLINKLSVKPRCLKVIFHDFPGGAHGFELIVRYCYNNGKIHITPCNVLLLHSAAKAMECNENRNGEPNLIDQTRKYLERFHCFTWQEQLSCLKHCQKLLPVLYDSHRLQYIMECVVERAAALSCAPNRHSSTSSSDSCSIDFSGDISIDTTRSYISQSSWWFSDLEFLSIELLKKVVETMISQKMDHFTISSFLCYYQRVKLHGASQLEKRKTIETLINLLYMLDENSISLKGLLRIFQASFALELSGCCINKLESMIGLHLDEALLDDLLLPSRGKSYAYDVNLVLRLLKHFLGESSKQFFLDRLKKVACLIDMYAFEIAADPGLKPSKFIALATSLPEFARDSHERMYETIDLYLKVHDNLTEEEKTKVSSAVKSDKCGAEDRKQSENEDKIFYKDDIESKSSIKKGGMRVSVKRLFRKTKVSKTHSQETRLSLPTLCS